MRVSSVHNQFTLAFGLTPGLHRIGLPLSQRLLPGKWVHPGPVMRRRLEPASNYLQETNLVDSHDHLAILHSG